MNEPEPQAEVGDSRGCVDLAIVLVSSASTMARPLAEGRITDRNDGKH
jgi:hypothetical protein